MSPDPYQPCPCGSGKKYKFCCKATRRYEPPKRPAAAYEDYAYGSESDVEADSGPGPGPLPLGGMGPADAMVAYAQPLLDATDGSEEQLQKAMTIAMACWNAALTPDEGRDSFFEVIRESLGMTPEEFAALRRETLDPLVLRHHEMFPELRERARLAFDSGDEDDSA